MKKLPKIIYVRWEGDRTNGEYMVVYKKPLEVAEPREIVKVGKYVLEGEIDIMCEVSISRQK